MTTPIKVFIGYDPIESVAYHTLCHSLIKHSSAPLQISPLVIEHLQRDYYRPRNKLQSNEFSFTRWLVPWLCDYEGWAIFLDCDILARADIKELWDLRNDRYAIQVVQHLHECEHGTKFLKQPQTPYERKNWSSVMLFNNAKCTVLTPTFVRSVHGLDLHQLRWTSDDLIGALPQDWNHLVGVHRPRPSAKLAHFTLGGPYFAEFSKCEFGEAWEAAREEMMSCQQLTRK